MRMLAIECATEACSVALFDNEELIANEHRVLGRGHAEHLVPMIAGLPDKGRAERIRVSRGPGSFTGARIGIATARALGIAWSAQVRGFPTLALVAASARGVLGDMPLLVCNTGGHGEWLCQAFGGNGMPLADPLSLRPDDAAREFDIAMVAGTQAQALVDLRGSGNALALHPDARFAMDLPHALVTEQVIALYGRPPDARLPPRS